MVSSVWTKSRYVLVDTYFHKLKPYDESRCVINSVLTAAANFATLSGGCVDKKPIRRPNISVQTASKPNKFTIFWKLSTTFVTGSRFVRNKSMKSSQMEFNAGKNACNTRGLVICDVNFVRKLCHVSPCLRCHDEQKKSYEFKYKLSISINNSHKFLGFFFRFARFGINNWFGYLLICNARASITVRTHFPIKCDNFGWWPKRIFTWVPKYFFNILTIV